MPTTPLRAEITKREFLLDIFEGIDHATSNVIVFAYREIDTGFMKRSLTLPRKEWAEMGCPTQITVTVELGNSMMNEEKPNE